MVELLLHLVFDGDADLSLGLCYPPPMIGLGLLLATSQSSWAASPGGFRTPGEDAAALATLRVAGVLNPGDEQILGGVFEGEVKLGKAQLGLSTGYTLAALGGEGVVDQGLAQSGISLLFPLEGRGAWSTHLGGVVSGAAKGSNAYSTQSSEVAPGGLLGGVLSVNRVDETRQVAVRLIGGATWHSAGTVSAGEEGVTLLHLDAQLFFAQHLKGAVWGGLETEFIPVDLVPLSFRPLLRLQPKPGAAFDLGAALPLHWQTYAATFPSSATLLARVTLWTE